MQITRFHIDGPALVSLDAFHDSRGFFVERFRANLTEKLALPQFVQDNFSRSKPGVLRGLHFQYDQPQGKLVTALSGRIFDVAVDIRANSPTYGQCVTVELDGNEPAWFWIPAGFAHGFQVLGSSPADVMYKVDKPHGPRGEGGILWNDPTLAVPWREQDVVLSEKDERQPNWDEYKRQPRF